LREETEGNDPDVDDHEPELVLKGERALQPEDGQVPDKHEGVIVEDNLDEYCVLEDEVDKTDEIRKLDKEVSCHIDHLDDCQPDQNAPGRRGHDPVDEDSSQVRPVLLKPDDSRKGQKEDKN